METQTPPNSQSLGGYPLSASGGIDVPATPGNLRSGSEMDVPDALTHPVEPAPNERPAARISAKRSGPPVLGIVFGALVLVVIIVLLITTGVFGLFG